jgi:hypothetical protein
MRRAPSSAASAELWPASSSRCPLRPPSPRQARPARPGRPAVRLLVTSSGQRAEGVWSQAGAKSAKIWRRRMQKTGNDRGPKHFKFSPSTSVSFLRLPDRALARCAPGGRAAAAEGPADGPPIGWPKTPNKRRLKRPSAGPPDEAGQRWLRRRATSQWRSMGRRATSQGSKSGRFGGPLAALQARPRSGNRGERWRSRSAAARWRFGNASSTALPARLGTRGMYLHVCMYMSVL